MNASELQQLIEAHLPDAEVIVRGDDGRHFQAIVVSPSFEGKLPVAQHRMVYAALGERVQKDEVHALALNTYTPAAWAREQGQA